MIPLSVIVIAKNEEKNIGDCLQSVLWCDDIVVVDAESSDATVALVKKFTSKIFVKPWNGFAEAKTFAVSQAKHDWILWLDADERVQPELAAEIQNMIASNPSYAAFAVARRAYFLGKWIRHSGWYPGRVPRLFNKYRATFSSVPVHEGLEIDGTVGRLRHDLLHFTDPNLFHYFEKFNRYTSLAAGEAFQEGKKFRRVDFIVRPPWLFFKMYILRLGFLDGTHGLLLAILSSAYVFTKYAKMWEACAHAEVRSGTQARNSRPS
ncbi:MAG: glycosyltransferase family 2 protein [Bacteroidota bacterium]|nr:glycosyltransferase family 2 protein [Bacteroidota bacterium]